MALVIDHALVELEFDQAAAGIGEWFTLDDPVFGELDGDYPLGGPTLVDVTAYATSISIDRGRATELDEFETGTCRVTFENDTRAFDPPFAGVIADVLTTDDDDELTTDDDDELLTDLDGSGEIVGPLGRINRTQRLRVSYDAEVVFDGLVTDWNHEWQAEPFPLATAEAVDGLGVLGRRKFREWTTTAGQRVGERLTELLGRPEVRYTGTTDFDEGALTLQSDLVSADTNVLNYAQLLALGDAGRLYASRANVLTYRDPNSVTDLTAVAAEFSDAEDALDFYGISILYGSEIRYTEVTVLRVGGTRQTATADGAEDDGDLIPLTIENVLLAEDADALAIAAYKLSRYEDPKAIVSGFRLPLNMYADADSATIASLDIGQLITVEWTPGGSGARITQTALIEGVRHDADRSGWVTSLNFSDASTRVGFILDSAELGVLDVNLLGV